MLRKGRPRAMRRAALATAIGNGRRITKCENRYQNPVLDMVVYDDLDARLSAKMW